MKKVFNKKVLISLLVCLMLLLSSLSVFAGTKPPTSSSSNWYFATQPDYTMKYSFKNYVYSDKLFTPNPNYDWIGMVFDTDQDSSITIKIYDYTQSGTLDNPIQTSNYITKKDVTRKFMIKNLIDGHKYYLKLISNNNTKITGIGIIGS